MKTQLQIRLSLVVWSLLVTILIFVGLALCVALIEPPNLIVKAIFSQFVLSSERSPPAFFSFLLLLICSLWLGAIALYERQIGSGWWHYWAFLGAMFLLMSYDEAAGLHEKLIEPLRDLLGAEGFFYYAWVIPGIILVVIIFAAYLPFLFHLPPLFRWLFMLSGAIYVGGAIGVEMISGNYIEAYGRDLTYRLITTVEESFEMLGAWLFIYSLMKYLTRECGSFELKIGLTNGAAVPVEVEPKWRRRAWVGPLTRSTRLRGGFFRGGADHRAASN
jgi:hypothetical protein